eukprot:scaffold669581_cov69-Prasinocladus_malaysianus.AAC.1
MHIMDTSNREREEANKARLMEAEQKGLLPEMKILKTCQELQGVVTDGHLEVTANCIVSIGHTRLHPSPCILEYVEQTQT